MRSKFLPSFALLLLFVAGAAAQAQPDTAARDFYKWYIAELNADRYPIRDHEAAVRKKVSARLGKWLYSEASEDYGADYFLSLQDWARSWANSVTAKTTSVSGNKAMVAVEFPRSGGFVRHRLRVSMVKESGVWKIDRVDTAQ
jgi:ABC-type transporter MlaC component